MICYHCARASALTNDSINFPHYARCNNKPKVRIPKRKAVNQVDLIKNKKQKQYSVSSGLFCSFYFGFVYGFFCIAYILYTRKFLDK